MPIIVTRISARKNLQSDSAITLHTQSSPPENYLGKTIVSVGDTASIVTLTLSFCKA